MMGMGEEPARAGLSRRVTEWRQPLKQRRIVEESEEDEEKEGEVEEKEKEVEKEKDGEGEEGMAPTEVRSEKGKERAVE